MGMKTILITLLFLGLSVFRASAAAVPITLGIVRTNGVAIVWNATNGATYSIQSKTNLSDLWADTPDAPNGIDATTNSSAQFFSVTSPSRYFRVLLNPQDMARIPAGNFQMGDTLGDRDFDGLPVHTVYVSAFYLDRYSVTKDLWDSVYSWAIAHGYSFDNPGAARATNHPVVAISWDDCVKWCNARSEMAGLVPAYYTDANQTAVYRAGVADLKNAFVKWASGFRLPTEAEWEKSARGGVVGKRFPLGDTITQSQANFFADPSIAYDLSGRLGYHPVYNSNVEFPLTNPGQAFASSGYGLFDMAGNVGNWCWDSFNQYTAEPQSDPRGGEALPDFRYYRGGSFYSDATGCRCAYRVPISKSRSASQIGFRTLLPAK